MAFGQLHLPYFTLGANTPLNMILSLIRFVVGSLIALTALAVHAANERDCRTHYQRADQAIHRAEVRDAQEDAVSGFPYLRSNRFLASQFAQNLNAEQFAFLLRQIRALDSTARRIEIGNLPKSAREALERETRQLLDDQNDVTTALEECGDLLLAEEQPSLEKLKKNISISAHYSLFKRVLGLYPLTAIPFSRGIRKFQKEMTQTFAKPLNEVIDLSNVVVHVPPAVAAVDVAAILREASKNPLQMPLPNPEQAAQLFAAFAPNFAVDTRGDFDRPGAIEWSGSNQVNVDSSNIRVYNLMSHTSLVGQTLLQLNYMIWFSERPKKGVFDMLGGVLDGLIWRVTLAPDGTPLLHDTIHPCGCYHLFFPSEKLHAKPPHSSLQEHAFVPQSLPTIKEGERLTVWIESATHYVVRVSAEPERDVTPYAFARYDDLRSLPTGDGASRSLFRPDALINGTERGERFLFWPMGIASAGAMRQWGHHATAFVGMRHFDDADLLDKAFDWLKD
jgi:hypothetical protein